MQITETAKVTRNLHVAPCLKCAGANIKFTDCGYWQGNTGGGKCGSCGNEVRGVCGPDPKIDTLVGIWNSKNDIEIMIAAEEKTIAEAQARINALRASKV